MPSFGFVILYIVFGPATPGGLVEMLSGFSLFAFCKNIKREEKDDSVCIN